MAERSEAVEEQAVRDGSAAYTVEHEIATSEDVPPGYKRTEVGVIPEEWEVKHLSELGVPYAGLTYKPSNVRSFGSLVLRSSNIKEGKLVFNSDDVFVDAKIPERAIVREGDILICVRNGSARLIGKCARIPKSAAGHAFGAFMTVFRANDNGLAFYLFQSDIVQRQIKERMGATINQITGKDLSEFLVPVPTAVGEKRAIATALSDADALIESLDRLIAKKRAIKQAAMQQLLTGQTRLPGFTGEWETKAFGQVLERKNLKSLQIQTADYRDSGAYPVVDQGQEAVVGFTDRHDKVFSCPKTGVIVFGDHTCIVKFVDFDFAVGADGTQVLEAKPGQCTRFYGYHLEYDGVQPTGYNRHFKFLKEKNFPVPEKAEQTAIATVLSDMDTEIEALEHRRDKARQIKQGMMQQLLTGRVRLVEENREDASYG